MKSKELREKAGEISKKLEVLTLTCRQEGRAPNETEQHEFAELKETAKRYLTEAEGYEMLDGFEGEKLTRYKRNDINFNSHVNTREKANPELALRSFLGRSAGLSNPEWDAHAEQCGMSGKIHNRAWSSMRTNLGKEFVPSVLGDEIYRKLFAFGGILNYLSGNGGVFNSADGAPFSYPIFDATALTGAQIDEGTADSTVDLASASKAFSAYAYTSGIQLVSFQAIRDSKFPLVETISSGLAESLGRAISQKLITGTASNQPEGVITNAPTGITTASPTTFTYDEIVGMMFAVNEPHASNGVWVVSRSALQVLMTLKDTIGRPLWLPAITAGAPSTLLGHDLYVDLNMAAVGAGSKSVIFGDIARGYKVRLVGDLNVRVSDERYFEKNSSGIVANQFLDARAIDTACYAVLTQHA